MPFDGPSATQNDVAKKSPENTASSGLNLVSISKSETIGKQSSAISVDSLSDSAHRILRDNVAQANDKVRYFPKSLSPDALEMTDPFDQCNPQDVAKKSQQTPEEIAQKEITKLRQEIEKNEKSPSENGKWIHGANLQNLAQYEMSLGLYRDANKHLRQSVGILRKELPNQPDQTTAEKALMLTQYDLGVSYVRPRTDLQEKSKVITARQQGDSAFKEALTLAKKLNVSPLEQADAYREKLANLVLLAGRHDTKNPEGKQAYRDEMKSVIDSYKEPLGLLKNDKSNDSIAAKAQLTGDLAFAEASRADEIGDEDTKNAVPHYENALELWQQYNVKTGATSDAQVKVRQDSMDKNLLSLLPSYIRLLKATGNNERAEEINQAYQSIVDRHPEYIAK